MKRLESTSPQYPGRLAEVAVEEGSNVTPGQAIAAAFLPRPGSPAAARLAQADVQHSKGRVDGGESGHRFSPERAPNSPNPISNEGRS